MKEIITKLQEQIKELESMREKHELSFEERHALLSIEIDLSAIIMKLEMKEDSKSVTNNEVDTMFLQQEHFRQMENDRLFTEQQHRDMYNHMSLVHAHSDMFIL